MRDRPCREGKVGAAGQQLLDQIRGQVDLDLERDIGHFGFQRRNEGRQAACSRDLPRADPHHAARLVEPAAAEQGELHVAQ